MYSLLCLLGPLEVFEKFRFYTVLLEHLRRCLPKLYFSEKVFLQFGHLKLSVE